MNISQAANASGLPAKTIRYYEEIGLIHPLRLPNGYRDYAADDVERLRFLRRARSLGFSIDECRMLMTLQADKSRRSAEVRAIAEHHVADIDKRISDLHKIRHTLELLIEACPGDDSRNCAILNGLAGQKEI